MIKDDFILSPETMYRPMCSACLNTFHSLEKCPYTHFIPDPEKIIKTYCFASFSDRIHFKRFKRIKNLYSPILD